MDFMKYLNEGYNIFVKNELERRFSEIQAYFFQKEERIEEYRNPLNEKVFDKKKFIMKFRSYLNK